MPAAESPSRPILPQPTKGVAQKEQEDKEQCLGLQHHGINDSNLKTEFFSFHLSKWLMLSRITFFPNNTTEPELILKSGP